MTRKYSKRINFDDCIGKVYGKLTITAISDYCASHGRTQVECICECGKTTTKIWAMLRSGKTKSCGCIGQQRKENFIKNIKLTRKAKFNSIMDDKADKFTELYMSGINVRDCCDQLDLNYTLGYKIKDTLKLPKQLWERAGMPETFSPNIIDILYGILLGDGSIHIPGWGTNKSFTVSHSPKQKEYIEYKRKLLETLKPHGIKKQKDIWHTLSFRTLPHPEFNRIFDEFYPNGDKQVTRSILDKLTPQGIALWFMDDGCLKRNSKSLYYGHGFSIATCSFDEISMKNIVTYFQEKYNISCLIDQGKYPRLNIYGKNAVAFKTLIEPFIIESMKYKIRLSDRTGRNSK